MNETNRSVIVLFCGVLIMLMAVAIFLTWSANTDVIDAVFDVAEYMEDHNDDPGRLIVTLAALIIGVGALLVIVLELAPEDEQKELRVQQAGATTIVPAQALRERLEEALVGLPEISQARVRVRTKDQGIVAALDVTVTPTANVAHVTQESTRVVIDTIQEDLGLPVSGTPIVRVAFGGPKPEPVASSLSQPPQQPPQEAQTGEPPVSPPPDYTQFQRQPPPSMPPYTPAAGTPPDGPETASESEEPGEPPPA